MFFSTYLINHLFTNDLVKRSNVETKGWAWVEFVPECSKGVCGEAGEGNALRAWSAGRRAGVVLTSFRRMNICQDYMSSLDGELEDDQPREWWMMPPGGPEVP